MADDSSTSHNPSPEEEGKILSEEVVPDQGVTVAVPAMPIPAAAPSAPKAVPTTMQASVSPLPTDAVHHSTLDHLYRPKNTGSEIKTPSTSDLDAPSQARFAPIMPDLPPLHNVSPLSPPVTQPRPSVPPVSVAPTPPAQTPQPVPPTEAPLGSVIPTPLPTNPGVIIQPPIDAPPILAPHTENRGKKTGLITGVIILLFVGGIGSALASYRFLPQLFYSIVPSGISQSLNTLWPLHSSIADMLPSNTAFYGSLYFNNKDAQGLQLQKIVNRIPGMSLNQQNEFEALIKDQLGLSFATDIEPVFDPTLSIAMPYADNPSVILALPIKNMSKMNALLKKMQSSTQMSQLLTEHQAIKGVDVYLITSSVVATPEDPATSALLSKVLPLGVSKMISASGNNLCQQLIKSCIAASTLGAQAKDSASPHPTLAFMVLDHQFIASNSTATLGEIITQSHSSLASLQTTPGFKQYQQQPSTIGSFFMNPQGLSTEPLYKGIASIYYSLSVDDNGFVIKSQARYDSAKLDPLLSKVLKAPAMIHDYAKELPASTAFFGQFGGLSDLFTFYAQQKVDNAKTGDAIVQEMLGVRLSDIASAIGSEAAIAYLPEPKSALVLKGEVIDAAKATAFIDSIAAHINATYKTTALASKESIGGGQAVVVRLANPLLSTGGYLEPTLLIVDNKFVLATSKNGALASMETPSTALTQDERYTLDQKAVGAPASSNWFVHAKRLYNGVIGTIRDILNDKNAAQSDQETVIDAYLDVLPSMAGASHASEGVSSSTVSVPVVDLEADRRVAIDALIKNKPKEIFTLAPFLTPFGLTYNAGPARPDNEDSATKSNLEIINYKFFDYLSTLNDVQKKNYITTMSQKLDPNNGLLKDMIATGALEKGMEGSDFPQYYYTYDFDGTVFRVTGLTINAYSTGELNCQDPKKIRDRYTYCIEDKI